MRGGLNITLLSILLLSGCEYSIPEKQIQYAAKICKEHNGIKRISIRINRYVQCKDNHLYHIKAAQWLDG